MKNLLILLIAITFFACSSGEKKTEEKSAAPAEYVEVSLGISGMTCEHCVASVTKGIDELDGIESVAVTLSDSTAVVKYNAAALDIDDIKKAVEKRGYTVRPSE